MTVSQENYLSIVRKSIRDIRRILDGVMYGSEPVTDDEFKRIRECYDFICKANDKL